MSDSSQTILLGILDEEIDRQKVYVCKYLYRVRNKGSFVLTGAVEQ